MECKHENYEVVAVPPYDPRIYDPELKCQCLDCGDTFSLSSKEISKFLLDYHNKQELRENLEKSIDYLISAVVFLNAANKFQLAAETEAMANQIKRTLRALK